jgi:hypothetical protein
LTISAEGLRPTRGSIPASLHGLGLK